MKNIQKVVSFLMLGAMHTLTVVAGEMQSPVASTQTINSDTWVLIDIILNLVNTISGI